MLNPREYQTPNALDPGEAPPSRPSRRAPADIRSNAARLLGEADRSSSVRSMQNTTGTSNSASFRVFPYDAKGDADDDYVHDQLPSVEEARMYAGRILSANSTRDLTEQQQEERARLTNSVPITPLGSAQERRNRLMCNCCCAFVGLIAIIFIAVFVHKEQEHLRHHNAPTTAPVPVSPDNQTPPPALPTGGLSERLNQALQFLSANAISDPETLLIKSSPQYEAAVWMADRDLLRYKIPTSVQDKSTRFLQRYILVVFYLATRGPQWRNQLQFLDKTDECAWFRSETLTDGSVVAVGVTCTENEEVQDILMREFDCTF